MEYKLLIKEFRIAKGMTQKELARISKVKQAYISQLENNKNLKSPTLRIIFKIANALEICPHLIVMYNINCNLGCCNYCKQIFLGNCIRHYVIPDIQHKTSPVQFNWGDDMAGEKFTIYMDTELKKSLKKTAIDENRSASEIISELVTNYLKNKKR